MGDGCAHSGSLTIFCCCFRCCRLCSNSWGRTWAAAEVQRPTSAPPSFRDSGDQPHLSASIPPFPLRVGAPLQALLGVALPPWGCQTDRQCPKIVRMTGMPGPSALLVPCSPPWGFLGRGRTCPGGVPCLSSCPDASSYPARTKACNHKQKRKTRSGAGPWKGDETDGAAPSAQRISPSTVLRDVGGQCQSQLPPS